MASTAYIKRIVIIAGPNGAGKTTFARVKLKGFELFNQCPDQLRSLHTQAAEQGDA